MRGWRRYLFFSACAAVGSLLSLFFFTPHNTPLGIWLFASGFGILMVNGLVYLGGRRSHKTTAEQFETKKLPLILMMIVAAIEVILSIADRLPAPEMAAILIAAVFVFVAAGGKIAYLLRRTEWCLPNTVILFGVTVEMLLYLFFSR